MRWRVRSGGGGERNVCSGKDGEGGRRGGGKQEGVGRKGGARGEGGGEESLTDAIDEVFGEEEAIGRAYVAQRLAQILTKDLSISDFIHQV